MIKKILIGLLLFIIALLSYVAMQPDEFSVSRSAVINASPEVVYGHVNDLKKWNAWSPWVKMDPAMKQTFEGPATGVGSSMRWVGNQQVGEGSMTITQSQPHEVIGIRLDFLKPFESTSDVKFTFAPEGTQTKVTWTMGGKSNFVGKAAGLVFNMDEMIGGQFQDGLSAMKAEAEKPAPAPAAPAPAAP